MKHNPYPRLMLMVALSFIAMYILMYAMVDSFGSVYNNFNQAYMAGLMAAPMLGIELLVMAGMYQNKRLNTLLVVSSLVLTAVFFTLIRQQTVISDRQFLRSMIPHHSGAILMCEEATLTDPRISALCRQIIDNQQKEIAEMRALLHESGGGATRGN